MKYKLTAMNVKVITDRLGSVKPRLLICKVMRVQLPFPPNMHDWCNGNTPVFQTGIIGSSPLSCFLEGIP